MRRIKTTTFGQRGGEGPNTGKKAVTFEFTRPDGVSGKTRVFKDIPSGDDAFVVLYPPHNGHGWHTGKVEASASAFDRIMTFAQEHNEKYPKYAGPMPVVVPCKRISKV
jgi:hypothetical protein